MEHVLFDEIVHVEKTSSTMKLAEIRIRDGLADGNMLVYTDEQTGGRGRGDNVWFSPSGGLWMTMALYGLSVQPSLTLFTGVCLHRAVRAMLPAGARLQLKWPNDLILEGKKMAGILTTQLTAKKYHLIGIGVDSDIEAMPAEIDDIAVSMRMITGQPVDNEELMRRMFDEFAAGLPLFIDQGFAPSFDYFREHDFLVGKYVTLESEFSSHEGTAKGVNRQGALLIELDNGMIQPFYAGMVSKVREKIAGAE